MSGDPLGVVEIIDALVLPGGDDFPQQTLPPPYPDDVVFDPSPQPNSPSTKRYSRPPGPGPTHPRHLLRRPVDGPESGGTLHHHLPLDLPEAGPHQLPEPGGRHRVRIESGTRLASLLGDGDTQVNSLHHQCIAQAGKGMRVSARAEDGVIEAIETDEDRFEVGVQWHPEKLEGPVGARLFEGLIAACAQRRAQGSHANQDPA